MKKKLLFFFGFCLLLLLGLLVYAWFFVYNKPHRDIENAKPDFVLDARAFIGEFDANDTASDRKYTDKVIQFSGELKKAETADSAVSLVFDYGTDHILSAQLAPKYNAEFSALNPGASVTLKGLYNGRLPGDSLFGLPGTVLLNKCSPVR